MYVNHTVAPLPKLHATTARSNFRKRTEQFHISCAWRGCALAALRHPPGISRRKKSEAALPLHLRTHNRSLNHGRHHRASAADPQPPRRHRGRPRLVRCVFSPSKTQLDLARFCRWNEAQVSLRKDPAVRALSGEQRLIMHALQVPEQPLQPEERARAMSRGPSAPTTSTAAPTCSPSWTRARRSEETPLLV